jgi:methyltransferase family protein
MTLNIPIGRYCLRLFPRNQPVPLSRIVLLRKISYGTNPLTAPYRALQQSGIRLRNSVLARLLAEEEMGTWSMLPSTMNFIETEIRDHKPSVVLELGSGLSTICLAQYMRELHGDSDRVRVISLEQDRNVVERTVERLKALGTVRNVKLFHAPVVPQTLEGAVSTCYSLPEEFLRLMDSLRPDFAVIDGPAAEGGRFGTLPLVRPYLSPNTRFYLDDALRDSEIDIAERWSRLPYIQLHGVYINEKGMLLGEARGGA